MAIAKKPKALPEADESTVTALINKGGSAAVQSGRQPQPEAELASVLLRLPTDMLARIDASVKRRLPMRISRVAWIIEALHERLQKEEKDI